MTDRRSKLLAGTISGTDTAFDLIEEISAIPGVKWSHAPGIDLRGSIAAAAPAAERVRAADPETDEPFESPVDGRSLRWINEGEQEAFCPITIREWHARKVDDMMLLECIHTEPWDAVSKVWWERFPNAFKEPVAALWPVPVPMIPWMLVIHAADECPLEGEPSVEPHKTPYTLDQLLITVKALHAWLLETTRSRPARIDEPRVRETST